MPALIRLCLLLQYNAWRDVNIVRDLAVKWFRPFVLRPIASIFKETDLDLTVSFSIFRSAQNKSK